MTGALAFRHVEEASDLKAQRCEASGCNATARGKPFCEDHLDELPQVRALRESIARLEAERERVLRGKPVALDGPILDEVTASFADGGGIVLTQRALARRLLGDPDGDDKAGPERIDALVSQLVRAGRLERRTGSRGETDLVLVEGWTPPAPPKEVHVPTKTKSAAPKPTRCGPRSIEWMPGLGPEQIKAWRKANGVTQVALGALVGVSGASVVNWEQGKKPYPSTQARLVEVLSRGRGAAPVASVAPAAPAPREAPQAPSRAAASSGPSCGDALITIARGLGQLAEALEAIARRVPA